MWRGRGRQPEPPRPLSQAHSPAGTIGLPSAHTARAAPHLQHPSHPPILSGAAWLPITASPCSSALGSPLFHFMGTGEALPGELCRLRLGVLSVSSSPPPPPTPSRPRQCPWTHSSLEGPSSAPGGPGVGLNFVLLQRQSQR